MNANPASHPTVRNRTGSLSLQKLLISSLMIALLLTSFSAHAVSAAPASDGTTIDTSTFKQEWNNKIDKVHYNTLFYGRVRVYPAYFEDPAELAAAHEILNNYGLALRGAQRVILNQAGFDQKGNVTNATLADQSLKDLSENLRIMRVLKQKLDRLEGDYILLPASAITTAAQ